MPRVLVCEDRILPNGLLVCNSNKPSFPVLEHIHTGLLTLAADTVVGLETSLAIHTSGMVVAAYKPLES